MIKYIFNLLGYAPKEQLLNYKVKISQLAEEIDKTLDALESLKKSIEKTEAKNKATIKKLNKNNLRLLKRQGEYKETIKHLQEKLNERH